MKFPNGDMVQWGHGTRRGIVVDFIHQKGNVLVDMYKIKVTHERNVNKNFIGPWRQAREVTLFVYLDESALSHYTS